MQQTVIGKYGRRPLLTLKNRIGVPAKRNPYKISPGELSRYRRFIAQYFKTPNVLHTVVPHPKSADGDVRRRKLVSKEGSRGPERDRARTVSNANVSRPVWTVFSGNPLRKAATAIWAQFVQPIRAVNQTASSTTELAPVILSQVGRGQKGANRSTRLRLNAEVNGNIADMSPHSAAPTYEVDPKILSVGRPENQRRRKPNMPPASVSLLTKEVRPIVGSRRPGRPDLGKSVARTRHHLSYLPKVMTFGAANRVPVSVLAAMGIAPLRFTLPNLKGRQGGPVSRSGLIGEVRDAIFSELLDLLEESR